MFKSKGTFIFMFFMMFNYVRQCTTKNTHHYITNFVAHKYFTCKTFFLNSSFSVKPRITAKKGDNLRKDKTSCEFPISTLSHPKSRKWDSTLRMKWYSPCISTNETVQYFKDTVNGTLLHYYLIRFVMISYV